MTTNARGGAVLMFEVGPKHVPAMSKAMDWLNRTMDLELRVPRMQQPTSEGTID